jgi:hypothetical protein
MAIKIGRFLRVLFWIKLVPVRRQKPLRATGQQCTDDGHGVEPLGWEMDYFSGRSVALYLVCIGANAAYLYFTYSYFTGYSEPTIGHYTVLLFKIVSMVSSFFIPWFLGSAACVLGPLALPSDLVVSKQDLTGVVGAPLIFTLGLIGLHTHALCRKPIGAVPIIFSALLSGLSFLAAKSMSFAWMQEFLRDAGALGQKAAISATEVDAVLARFQRLKAALSDGMFYMIGMSQIVQIFAAYNMLAGRD